MLRYQDGHCRDALLRQRLFYHTQPVTTITDISLALCDRWRSDWGSEEVSQSIKTALEAAPNPFSALFDNLSH